MLDYSYKFATSISSAFYVVATTTFHKFPLVLSGETLASEPRFVSRVLPRRRDEIPVARQLRSVDIHWDLRRFRSLRGSVFGVTHACLVSLFLVFVAEALTEEEPLILTFAHASPNSLITIGLLMHLPTGTVEPTMSELLTENFIIDLSFVAFRYQLSFGRETHARIAMEARKSLNTQDKGQRLTAATGHLLQGHEGQLSSIWCC